MVGCKVSSEKNTCSLDILTGENSEQEFVEQNVPDKIPWLTICFAIFLLICGTMVFTRGIIWVKKGSNNVIGGVVYILIGLAMCIAGVYQVARAILTCIKCRDYSWKNFTVYRTDNVLT